MGRRKVQKFSQEELMEQTKQRELNELMERIKFIPEPTYKIANGTEVVIGNLEDVIVVDSLENGKIYEIDFTRVDNNYGNPIRHEHQRRYVTWLDIRLKNSKQESLICNEDIKLNFS